MSIHFFNLCEKYVKSHPACYFIAFETCIFHPASGGVNLIFKFKHNSLLILIFVDDSNEEMNVLPLRCKVCLQGSVTL